ncbi:MAG TPA: hypothetical protein PLC28_19255 [Spirochaetota bacterium]|nr:hypothetical protein [Spirochaetota bacterium]HQJ72853.1 hypothetical protein [Spirochaetota bacterium]HRT77308.1 hypothetical protein [Spirochaetota bacterium]
MRIVFYTSGITGAGRLVLGISIGNALARHGIECKYTIVHTSPVAFLANDLNNIKIPLENETELSPKNFHKSILYKTLAKLKPDILIVNHTWFMIYNIIEEMKCQKLYLSDYVYDSHFKVPIAEGVLSFKPEQYERLIAIEPFKSPIPMENINPLVMRNRDEILSRDKAIDRLGLDNGRKIALYAYSGNPEDQSDFMDKYQDLENNYQVVKSSVFDKGLFPIVDYYNAFDFIICTGGYNFVWDSVYFMKKAVFEPVPVIFCDQKKRIENSRDFSFDVNGADQLIKNILAL